MKLKRIIAGALALCYTSAFIPTIMTSANDMAAAKFEDVLIENPNGVWDDPVMYRNVDMSIVQDDTPISIAAILPSSVDLSTSPCFPDLGNQAPLASCVAFATTYYQFSYEVNKLNGVTSSSQREVYSPKWTYNLINGGTDLGANMENAYLLLSNFGAVKYNDFPYDNSDFTTIPGNSSAANQLVDERIEALQTRVSLVYSLTLPNSGTFVTSPTDTDLNAIKNQLNSGKMLTAVTRTSFDTMYGSGSYSSFKICYRCHTTSNQGGHAMAIVGYDDNICCDVNGNGTIEPCEKGAFKCANSYGTTGAWSDTNGYKWILYDAINAVSANTVNNWEQNLTGTRLQALRIESQYSNPKFWCINVEHKPAYYIGELDVNTNRFDQLDFRISRTNANSSAPSYSSYYCPMYNRNIYRSYSGKIIFDYDSYYNPIASYYSGYKWWAKLFPNSADTFSSRFRIVDSKENVLAAYEPYNSAMAFSNEKNKCVNVALGDVNYDGILTLDDADTILDYIARIVTFSSLQCVLADYNNDGNVNIRDVVALESYLSNRGVDVSPIHTKLQLYVQQGLIMEGVY